MTDDRRRGASPMRPDPGSGSVRRGSPEQGSVRGSWSDRGPAARPVTERSYVERDPQPQPQRRVPQDESRRPVRDDEPEERERGSILTATRVILGVALISSVAFIGYVATVRDAGQIPLLSIGSWVLGLVFLALAASSTRSLIKAGREGRGLKALLVSLVAGFAVLAAAGCFVAGYVLGSLAAS